MDITPLDITILVASTVGVILMTLTFPALGLSGEQAQENDVPDFDVDTSRFDLAGDFPRRPASPDGGTLTQPGDFSTWLTGGGENGQLLNIGNFGNETHPEPRFTLAHYDDGNTTFGVNETKTLNVSESVILENAEWRVRVEVTEVTTNGEATISGNYEVLDEGEGAGDNNQGWFSGIPVVGDAASGLQWVASTIIYLGNVMIWAVSMFFEVSWNMAFAVFDVASFMFELADWLITSYTDIVSAEGLAPWASVILIIPGVMLTIEWAKLVAVIIEVIWIG